MFGLEESHRQTRFKFDLEIELEKDKKKKKALLDTIEVQLKELKSLVGDTKGASQNVWGELYQGYEALKKTIGNAA